MTPRPEETIDIPKTPMFGSRLARALQNPSVFDAGAGLIIAAFAIIGLAGEAPRSMAALAFVGVGIAFVIEAAGISKRSQAMAPSGSRVRSEVGASALAQLLMSITGLLLAILALVGIEPLVMLAFASLVFGAALLLGTGAAVQVDTVAAYLEPSQTRRVIHEAVVGASGARVLLAVGSVVLGVLALAGVESLTLLLTTGLSLAVAVLLGTVSLGDSVSSRRATFDSFPARRDDVNTYRASGGEVPRHALHELGSTNPGLGGA